MLLHNEHCCIYTKLPRAVELLLYTGARVSKFRWNFYYCDDAFSNLDRVKNFCVTPNDSVCMC
jgi:hypothetical protein